MGTALCFPHGDTGESLVHEGSALNSGVKYIIRTDVLYNKWPDLSIHILVIILFILIVGVVCMSV
jgi:hypothetical protein